MPYTQLKLSNIQFLPSVILLFPLLVDALLPTNDHSTSDPIGESVFDLMATVLIASVITIDVDRIKRKQKFLLKTFFSASAFITYVIIFPMQIWFCVRAYKVTKDTFFIAYLITTLLAGVTQYVITLIVAYCITPVNRFHYLFGGLLSLTYSFGKEIIFGFLAVKRGYVNQSTCWFVFGPVIVAYLIGTGLFIYVQMNWMGVKRHLKTLIYGENL